MGGESKGVALIAVCSARPRPSVQRAGKGSQWWRRDPYHLRGDGNRTLCGRDCSEWLVVGPMAEVNDDCCERCRAKAHPQ